MTSRVLVQYGSRGHYLEMLGAVRARHAAYCVKYDADYHVGGNKPTWSGSKPRAEVWRKVELLIELVEQYEKILWLDVDSVIVRDDFDIFAAAGYGIAFCECWDSPSIERHINAGVVLVNRSPEIVEFLNEWNKSPGTPHWEDQAIMMSMMTQPKWRDLLTILPNRFNCVSVHMDARDPFIRSFHGDPQRLEKVRSICNGNSLSAASKG